MQVIENVPEDDFIEWIIRELTVRGILLPVRSASAQAASAGSAAWK